MNKENILQYLEPEIKAAIHRDYMKYIENVMDDEFMSFKVFVEKQLHKYD